MCARLFFHEDELNNLNIQELQNRGMNLFKWHNGSTVKYGVRESERAIEREEERICSIMSKQRESRLLHTLSMLLFPFSFPPSWYSWCPLSFLFTLWCSDYTVLMMMMLPLVLWVAMKIFHVPAHRGCRRRLTWDKFS